MDVNRTCCFTYRLMFLAFYRYFTVLIEECCTHLIARSISG
jgi:hypothetical protein